MDWFDLVDDVVEALPAKWVLGVLVLALVGFGIWWLTTGG